MSPNQYLTIAAAQDQKNLRERMWHRKLLRKLSISSSSKSSSMGVAAHSRIELRAGPSCLKPTSQYNANTNHLLSEESMSSFTRDFLNPDVPEGTFDITAIIAMCGIRLDQSDDTVEKNPKNKPDFRSGDALAPRSSELSDRTNIIQDEFVEDCFPTTNSVNPAAVRMPPRTNKTIPVRPSRLRSSYSRSIATELTPQLPKIISNSAGSPHQTSPRGEAGTFTDPSCMVSKNFSAQLPEPITNSIPAHSALGFKCRTAPQPRPRPQSMMSTRESQVGQYNAQVKTVLKHSVSMHALRLDELKHPQKQAKQVLNQSISLNVMRVDELEGSITQAKRKLKHSVSMNTCDSSNAPSSSSGHHFSDPILHGKHTSNSGNDIYPDYFLHFKALAQPKSAGDLLQTDIPACNEQEPVKRTRSDSMNQLKPHIRQLPLSRSTMVHTHVNGPVKKACRRKSATKKEMIGPMDEHSVIETKPRRIKELKRRSMTRKHTRRSSRDNAFHKELIKSTSHERSTLVTTDNNTASVKCETTLATGKESNGLADGQTVIETKLRGSKEVRRKSVAHKHTRRGSRDNTCHRELMKPTTRERSTSVTSDDSTASMKALPIIWVRPTNSPVQSQRVRFKAKRSVRRSSPMAHSTSFANSCKPCVQLSAQSTRTLKVERVRSRLSAGSHSLPVSPVSAIHVAPMGVCC